MDEMLEEALVELNEHSLIKLESTAFSCHRLLQAVLQDRIETNKKTFYLEAIAALLAEQVDPDRANPKTWPVWRMLQPQIETVLSHAEGTKQVRSLPYLMRRLAHYYDEIGEYSRAERLTRKALEVKMADTGSQISDLINYKMALATSMFHLAHFAGAEKLCREIVAECEIIPDVEALLLSEAYAMLARSLAESDRFQEAEMFFSKALRTMEADSKTPPSQLAGAINNLATLLLTTRRFTEAERLFRRSLILLESHPKDNSDFAILPPVLSNLARCLHEQGYIYDNPDYLNEAENLYRRVLSIHKGLLGNEHPVYARDANNLGWLLGDMGKLTNKNLFFVRR